MGDPDQARDATHRYRGFTDALSAAGLLEAGPPLRVSFGAADLGAVADAVLAEAGVQALVCANDELALGLIRQLRKRGVRVPDDVAVTGWDDVMAARYTDLTTVRQPAREVGRVAAPTAAAVTLTLTDGRVVVWGSTDRSQEKAEKLAALLTVPGRSYDVSSPELATVK